jgi:hypothetical protein
MSQSGAAGWTVTDVVLHLAQPDTVATTDSSDWAHGLDITGPSGIEFPDTGRLRHVAWLAHRTLPYSMTRAGEQPVPVRCEQPVVLPRWFLPW